MSKLRSISLFVIGFFVLNVAMSQDRYFTKSGKIHFDATTPTSPEPIAATTNTAICVIDKKTGAVQFSVVLKGFEFKNALMQEHFNENYVESHKFPKSEFKGSILNNDEINYAKDGTYKAKVKGTISLHGISKDIETDGQVVLKNGNISVNALFTIPLKNHNITVPNLVADKVATAAKINLECALAPLK